MELCQQLFFLFFFLSNKWKGNRQNHAFDMAVPDIAQSNDALLIQVDPQWSFQVKHIKGKDNLLTDYLSRTMALPSLMVKLTFNSLFVKSFETQLAHFGVFKSLICQEHG